MKKLLKNAILSWLLVIIFGVITIVSVSMIQDQTVQIDRGHAFVKDLRSALILTSRSDWYYAGGNTFTSKPNGQGIHVDDVKLPPSFGNQFLGISDNGRPSPQDRGLIEIWGKKLCFKYHASSDQNGSDLHFSLNELLDMQVCVD